MGNSHSVDVAGLDVAEPGAHDRYDLSVDHAGQMTADGVIRQRRAVGLQGLYVAVGQKAQLNEGLEAVADAEGQAVALIQERFEGFRKGGVAEQCRNELARAFRFIAGAEAAGEHDDLSLGDALGHFVDRFGQILRRVVAQDHDVRYCAGPFKGFGRVVFAVRARAYGDEDAGLAEGFAAARAVGGEQGQLGIAFAAFALDGEYAVQRFFPGFLQVG